MLEAASNGQGFSPSVLAPKAHVILDDSVASIGGFLVSRSLGDRGQKTHSLQLKGEGYAGAGALTLTLAQALALALALALTLTPTLTCPCP